jgi:transposase
VLDSAKDISHAGCWAHVSRKFTEAAKGAGKDGKAGSIDIALGYIRRIYKVVAEGRKANCTPEQLLFMRQEKPKPIVMDYFAWLSKKALMAVPKSLLGVAVNYTPKQWNGLLVISITRR